MGKETSNKKNEYECNNHIETLLVFLNFTI